MQQNAPGRLHGIAMDDGAEPRRDPRCFRDGLKHAGFIIGSLKRNQSRAPGSRVADQRVFQRVEAQHSGRIDRQDLRRLLGKAMATQDGRVLHRAHEKHVACNWLAGNIQLGRERQCIRLGGAGGEHDGRARRSAQGRHFAPCLLQPRPSRPPLRMDRGGIARRIQHRQHRSPGFRPQGGGRIVVEIGADGRHDRASGG